MAKISSFTSIAAASLLAMFAAVGTAQAAAPQAGGSVALTTGGPVSSSGTDLTLDVTGIKSFDGLDSAFNTTLVLDVAPNALIDAISYSLTITTADLSYLEEVSIQITNSAGDGVFFSPGFGDAFSGTGTYADSILLSSQQLSFNAGSDGKLYLQFFEDFDDVAGVADATYVSGSITFSNVTAVPEPSTYALMAFGLLGCGLAARRSRA